MHVCCFAVSFRRGQDILHMVVGSSQQESSPDSFIQKVRASTRLWSITLRAESFPLRFRLAISSFDGSWNQISFNELKPVCVSQVYSELRGETILARATTVKMPHRQEQFIIKYCGSIATCDRFRGLTGWRKGAFVNTILVFLVLLILIISHIHLWTTSGDPFGYHIIHSGRCAGNGVGRLNTLLHLIINILLTLVLASTQLFHAGPKCTQPSRT